MISIFESDKKFIRVWMRSGSIEEAARELGISENGAYGKYRRFLRNGVKLKPLPRSVRPLHDWPALIAYAEKEAA